MQKNEHYKSLQTEAEYRKIIGQMAEVDAVRVAGVDAATTFRSMLEGLPDQVHAILRNHFEHVLGEVSHKLTALVGDKL